MYWTLVKKIKKISIFVETHIVKSGFSHSKLLSPEVLKLNHKSFGARTRWGAYSAAQIPSLIEGWAPGRVRGKMRDGVGKNGRGRVEAWKERVGRDLEKEGKDGGEKCRKGRVGKSRGR